MKNIMNNKRIAILLLLVTVTTLLLVGCGEGISEPIADNLTVNFNVSGSTYKTLNVEKGASVQSITAPDKYNQIFLGWYNNGDIVEFPLTITEDTTLYALYEDKTDYNKKAFVKFMKSNDFDKAIANFPDHYTFSYGENTIFYAPAEDKLRVMNSHDYGDSKYTFIMLDWKYGEPNTMKGAFEYFIGDGTGLACDITSVSFDSYGKMTTFRLGNGTHNLDYTDSVKYNLLIVQNTILDDLPSLINGVTPDFNLFLGY